MMANLRYNKKLSSILNKLTSKENVPSLSFAQLCWHTDNSDKIFISEYNSLFRSDKFLITYYNEQGRLYHVTKKGLCSTYLIEDVEEFLKACAFYIQKPKENLYLLLKNSSILPLQGIIRNEKNCIQVYNHKNY